MKPSVKRFLLRAAGALAIVLVMMQFAPSSFDRTAPAVTGEPTWDAPQTRTVFMTACGDCHSNETRYPWYSHVAPVSWLIEKDIRNGRRHFNISEWDTSQRGGEDAAQEVERGSMPVGPYLMMHPEANLSAPQKKAFVEGLLRTFGGEVSSRNAMGGNGTHDDAKDKEKKE